MAGPTETSVYLLDLDARQLIESPTPVPETPMARRRSRSPRFAATPNPSRCSACFTASLARQCNLFSTSTATASRHSAQPRACATFVSSTPPTTRPGARLAPPSFSPNVAW